MQSAVQDQLPPPPDSWPQTRHVVQPDRVQLSEPACPPHQQQQQQQQWQQLPQPPSAAGQISAAAAQSRQASSTTRKQRRKRGASHQHLQQQQQEHHHHLGAAATSATKPKAPIKYRSCGKRDGLQLAGSISQQLRKGHQVLVPAGAGMQLVRNTAMLSTTRSLMLSKDNSTGLVFQPSFSVAAGPAALQQQQQQLQQQQGVHPHAATALASTANSSSNGINSNGRSSTSSTSKGVMLLVSAVSEAQLRRFDQQPLIAARSTRAPSLAAAVFARLCQRGFTSVRAAGPEATRLAMLAAAEARSKLLGCGLDLAVVPATDYVDVESLVGADGLPQSPADLQMPDGQEGGVGPGEELPTQFVRVTVLHLVRCEPQQPGRLLPWAVPAEMLPAVRHAHQQQQQELQQQQQRQPLSSLQQQQQQQQQVPVGAGVADQQAGSGGYVQSPRHHQQQQQQQQPEFQLGVPAAPPTPAAVFATRGWLAAAEDSLQQQLPGKGLGGVAAAADAWAVAAAAASPSRGADLLLGADELLKLHAAEAVASSSSPSDAAEAEAVGAGPSQGSSSTGMAVRQPGGLLLQQHKLNKKKASRQLVAAAQAGSSSSSTPAASRSSSSAS